MACDTEELLRRMEALSDEKYRAFNEGLTPGAEGRSLGVRMPQLRKIAREILAGDPDAFLDATLNSAVHELNLLHAMVLAGQKGPMERRLARLNDFVPTIDNWAVCDVLCADLKPTTGQLEAMLDLIRTRIDTGREFEVRFGYVMLMLYYRGDAWIEETLRLYGAFHHDGYYARMGAAWGLSVLFVHQRERTLAFLQSDNFDRFTHNKALQKCIESHRVSADDKRLLRTLRR